MEASITRRHEPREAVTVTAHTYRWENSLLESVCGNSGTGLGCTRMVGQIFGVCFDLLPKALLWTHGFPRPPTSLQYPQ